MTVGLGIFLSTILIGIIILFIFTKDRWNWKKIFIWFFGIFLFLIIVITVATEISKNLKNKPKIQNAYWGVFLGMSKSDLLFQKGNPNKKYDDLNIWKYTKVMWDMASYFIQFKNDKVCIISSFDKNYNNRFSTSYGYYLFQGINIGDDTIRIIEKFGKPDSIEILEEGLIRIYKYSKYNLNFIFKKNRLISFNVFSTECDNLVENNNILIFDLIKENQIKSEAATDRLRKTQESIIRRR